MYVVYETATSRIVGVNTTEYSTEAAAKSARTRILKIKKKHRFDSRTEYKPEDLAVAEYSYYKANIEQKVQRVNLMTGKPYEESVNTPLCCSPASETYWSM